MLACGQGAGMSVMVEGGVAGARHLNMGGAHMGGARGWGRGAVMTHSVAGCEGALQRLQVKEGLALNSIEL